METKQVTAQLQKSNSAEHDARFIISSTGVDRDRDTFTEKALRDVATTTKSLIALFNHDHAKIVGVWENLKYEAGQLTADIRLAKTGMGKFLKSLLDEDIPLSSSVGFAVKDYTKNDHGGLSFKSVSMYECSIVAVPANPEAQRIKSLAKQYQIDLPEFEDGSSAQLSKEMDSRDVLTEAAAAVKKAEEVLLKYSKT